MREIELLIIENLDLDGAAADVEQHLLDCEEHSMQCRYSWHVDANDDVDFNDPEIAAEFSRFVREYAVEQVVRARWDLTCLDVNDDGTLTLWRSMVVPADWLENGINDRPIGIYWAYEKSAAEPHWGSFAKGDREIILEGRVALEDVDWRRSICMNAQCEEEREIRLKQTASVLLVSAEWAECNDFGAVALGFTAPAGEDAAASELAIAC